MKTIRSILFCIIGLLTQLVLTPMEVAAKNNCETNFSLSNPAMDIGGTGSEISRSDIGGTGAKVVNEGGIGGTGIIGTITGFASICVNGVEVHYDSNTPVFVDGRLATIRELAVGQVVIVRAPEMASEVTAHHISINHAVAGPINHIDHQTGEMHVLGQVVRANTLRELSNFKIGDWTQVSGHRLANGTIVASHIEVTPPASEAILNGYVTNIDTDGYDVYGTRIRHDFKSMPVQIAEGMEITVTGDWNGDNLQARHIQTEPTRHAIGRVEHLVIEGYIHALQGNAINLGNQTVNFITTGLIKDDHKDSLKLNQRVQINGRMGPDQRITADQIEIKPALSLPTHDRIDSINTDHNNENHKSVSDKASNTDSDKQINTDHQIQPLNKDGDNSRQTDDSKHQRPNQSQDDTYRQKDSANSSDRVFEDKTKVPREIESPHRAEKNEREINPDKSSDLSRQESDQPETRANHAADTSERMERHQNDDQRESFDRHESPARSTDKHDSLERSGDHLEKPFEQKPDHLDSRDTLEQTHMERFQDSAHRESFERHEHHERPRDSDNLPERPGDHLDSIRDSIPDRDVMPDRIRD
ncbi:MAG: hypothetical protein IT525_12545 [Nitrosomonas sp.]|jgi:hypothetical protein|nr:hypothetical protein [Nitrosomonas sp.]